jgi:hypothetical protein
MSQFLIDQPPLDAPNPGPQIVLEYNPYIEAFLQARRTFYCSGVCVIDTGERRFWSMLEHGLFCPTCGSKGVRAYTHYFLRAGRQSGKTTGGSLSAVEETLALPNRSGWCCAPTNPELYDYVIPAFFARLPEDLHPKNHPLADWSADRLVYTAPNGSQVKFRTLDDPNRAVGDTLDWIWMDEARKIQELAWNLARAMLKIKRGIAWFTSSPDWGEDWCHRNFWLPASRGVVGYWACTFKTTDNPMITADQVEADRAVMPPELFRREYEASIEFPTGTYFGELVDDVIAPTDELDDAFIRAWIPEWPEVATTREGIGGIDPGTDHPFGSSLIIPTVHGLVVVAEYCDKSRKAFFQHATSLKRMAGERPMRWAMQKFGGDAQAAIELNQHGIYPQILPGGPGSVGAGIQRIYAWMKTKRVRISRKTCPRLIEEMRKYRMAETKETNKGLPKDAEPYKKDDDVLSSFRYGVQLYPELPVDAPSLLSEDERKMKLLPWWQQEQIRMARAGCEDQGEDGNLIRVTDSFEPTRGAYEIHGQESPSGDFFT